MRLGILGRTQMLYNTILRLKDTDHEIAFIMTGKATPEYEKNENDFKMLAEKLQVPFFCTECIHSEESIRFIKENSPELGVSFNWKNIINSEVLDCFHKGIINAHAGDLPNYRGNAVPNWAIIAGESHITLTLHFMNERLDEGPVLLKKSFPIHDKYIEDIYKFMLIKTPIMFVEAVNGIESSKIISKPQDSNLSKSLRCYPRLPIDGEINWYLPAIDIERLIRACSKPFPGAYTFHGTDKVIIWKAHIEYSQSKSMGLPGSVTNIRKQTGEVTVLTGDGFIVMEEIEIGDSGRKKASELIKSMRTRFGLDVTGEIMRLHNKIEILEKELSKMRIN